MVFLDGARDGVSGRRVCGPVLWRFPETIFICNKVSGTFMYVDTFFSIKSKHTRIIKNCEFKKGSRDRSPKQKVRKQEL